MVKHTTFADIVLERCDKATPIYPTGELVTGNPFLYAKWEYKEGSQTKAIDKEMVSELARRLKKACEELRLSCITFRRCGQHDDAVLNEKIADELEAPLGEK